MINQRPRPVPFLHRLVDEALWTKGNLGKEDEKIKLEKVWFTENNIFFPDKEYPQPQTTYVSAYMVYVPGHSSYYVNNNGEKIEIPPFSDGDTIEMVRGFINNSKKKYKVKFHRELEDNNGNIYQIILGILRV